MCLVHAVPHLKQGQEGIQKHRGNGRQDEMLCPHTDTDMHTQRQLQKQQPIITERALDRGFRKHLKSLSWLLHYSKWRVGEIVQCSVLQLIQVWSQASHIVPKQYQEWSLNTTRVVPNQKREETKRLSDDFLQGYAWFGVNGALGICSLTFFPPSFGLPSPHMAAQLRAFVLWL